MCLHDAVGLEDRDEQPTGLDGTARADVWTWEGHVGDVVDVPSVDPQLGLAPARE
jgi:hypothetical protein